MNNHINYRRMIKRFSLFLLLYTTINCTWAQVGNKDSLIRGTVTVTKDERIDLLGKKMLEYNESLANKIHLVKGYRLMLLSTTDRSQALQVRSQLIRLFPEQSVYMTFQSPYIKLKFGNFLEKEEAEDMRKDIVAARIVPGNIYLVPEMVESKPDKTKIVAGMEE